MNQTIDANHDLTGPALISRPNSLAHPSIWPSPFSSAFLSLFYSSTFDSISADSVQSNRNQSIDMSRLALPSQRSSSSAGTASIPVNLLWSSLSSNRISAHRPIDSIHSKRSPASSLFLLLFLISLASSLINSSSSSSSSSYTFSLLFHLSHSLQHQHLHPSNSRRSIFKSQVPVHFWPWLRDLYPNAIRIHWASFASFSACLSFILTLFFFVSYSKLKINLLLSLRSLSLFFSVSIRNAFEISLFN